MNILLLEDDLILSAELCKFLESNEIICHKVFDGETFLREIKGKSYDLYLLDINVPNINGLVTPIRWLLGRLAPLANAAILPSSLLSMTTRLS